MYIKGLEYFYRSPILGFGLQGFRYFYGGYSHATLIEVPVTGGVVGTTLYLAFQISIVRQLCRRSTIGGMEFIQKRMGMVLFSALLFYSVAMIHIYEISSLVYFATIIAAYSMTSNGE